MILGGAALTRTYVERDLREIYKGRLFYGKDAFEGLHTMDTLMEGKRSGRPRPRVRPRARRPRPPAPRKSSTRADVAEPCPRAPTSPIDVPVFAPPFLGARVAKGIALDEIATYINETALFRNQWQFRPDKKPETDAEFKARIRAGAARAARRSPRPRARWSPRSSWGYFPVNAEGDDLVVWTDDDRRTERLRFKFPRQQKDRFLCISDFFRPVESGEADYAALPRGHRRARGQRARAELFAADRYQDYLLCHGLSVEMTEALAEYWHRRIREEWGFADEDGPTVAGLFRQQYRGSRYSWGYPACPDLEDQAKLDELLDLSSIGVTLTEEFQLEPEQSTSAIIVPHPEAKYFIA